MSVKGVGKEKLTHLWPIAGPPTREVLKGIGIPCLEQFTEEGERLTAGHGNLPAFTHIPLCTLGEVPGEEILKQGGVGESEAGNRRVFTTEESGGSEILLETFNVGV